MNELTIQIPDSLFEKLRQEAAKDQITPEHMAVLAIAEKLSSLLTVDYLEGRAKRAEPGNLKRLLSKVPDVEPDEYDKL